MAKNLNQPKAQVSKHFRDAVFVAGSIIARCGGCNTLWFSLDDPDAKYEELVPNINAARSEIDDLANIIRASDTQGNRGINGSYDPDKLLFLLHCIPDGDPSLSRIGETMIARIQNVFRVGENRAIGLDARLATLLEERDPLKASTVARPAIGRDSIATGFLDGRTVVEGCCEHRLAQYEECFWSSRSTIARFFRIRANQFALRAEDAEQDARAAEMVAKPEDE